MQTGHLNAAALRACLILALLNHTEPAVNADSCNKVTKTYTLLHGDYHLKNIMMSGEELMLIDMDTLCFGDPIFEMATMYNSYIEFPSLNPNAAFFLGIDVKTAKKSGTGLWNFI